MKESNCHPITINLPQTPSRVQAPQFSAIYIKGGSKSHVYEACLLDMYSISSAQPCCFTSPYLNVGVRQK